MRIQDLIDRLEIEKKVHGNIEVVSEGPLGDLVDLRIYVTTDQEEDTQEVNWIVILST